MTAPDKIWVNECDHTQCTDGYTPTGIEYTRTASIPTDARWVTVAQLERVVTLISDVTGYADIDDHICNMAVAELRAIIGKNGNG